MAQNGEGSLLSRLFRREPRPLRLTGYKTADVTEEKAVKLVAGAALAGHIRAPVVTIEGLLFGSTVARQVVIGSGGRVWGDVYAVSISVLPGGYVNGWVRSLSEDEYRSLCSQQPTDDLTLSPEVVQLPSEQLPAELRELWSSNHDLVDRALLQMFQAELRAAHLAREELDRQFEERVAQAAGITRARVAELEDGRDAAQREVEAIREERAEQEAELARWQERFEAQSRELAGVRSLLQQRAEALQRAEQTITAQQQQVGQLTEESALLQQQLRDALEPLEELQDRVESLESALRASVQRNAEQEEAQLRWQELAEVSRDRASELEKELEKAQRKFETVQQLYDELRERLARSEAEVALPGEGPEQPDGGRARQARLEAQLEAAQAELAELEEQLTWQQLAAEAAAARLASQSEQEAAVQAMLREQLDTAAARIHEYHEMAENWKANVGRLTELLYEARQQSNRQAAELEELRNQITEARAERKKLQKAATRHIVELQAELEAKERELAELSGRRESRRRS